MYLGLKYTHIILVAISIVLFQYRFLLKRLKKPIQKPLKIIPHINDTLLLLTGIGLVLIASFNPISHPWLLAKMIALLLYIGFGMLALKMQGIKCLFSYLIATSMVFFMVVTALKKQPFLFAT